MIFLLKSILYFSRKREKIEQTRHVCSRSKFSREYLRKSSVTSYLVRKTCSSFQFQWTIKSN